MNKLIAILCSLLFAASTAADTIKDPAHRGRAGERPLRARARLRSQRLGRLGQGPRHGALAQVLINSGNAAASKNSKPPRASLVMVKCVVPARRRSQGRQARYPVPASAALRASRAASSHRSAMRSAALSNSIALWPWHRHRRCHQPERPHQRCRPGRRLTARRPHHEAAGSSFNLTVSQHFAGHSATTAIASRINQEWFGTPDLFGPAVASVIDDRTIRIDVPLTSVRTQPRSSPRFSATRSTSATRLPAKIVVNRDTA